MARPQKEGIDYFPFDVDIFEDDKLFDVTNEFGPLGEVIYIRLLCLIYKNGYYYKFENLDKLSAMMIKSIGNRWARDRETVKQVIPFLAKCNLFSSELMLENVLTSASIQRRYLKATERRRSMNHSEYWMIDDDGNRLVSVPENGENVCNNSVFVYNNPVSVCNNSTKEKESKGKKSKVNYQLVADMYNETCVSFPRCTKLSDARKKAIKARLNSGYTYDDFKLVFEKAEKSRFLKGGNDHSWKADFDWLIKDSNMAKVLDGRYDERESCQQPQKNVSKFNNFQKEQEHYDFNALENAAMEKLLRGTEQ